MMVHGTILILLNADETRFLTHFLMIMSGPTGHFLTHKA
jgi:hypothetical protein